VLSLVVAEAFTGRTRSGRRGSDAGPRAVGEPAAHGERGGGDRLGKHLRLSRGEERSVWAQEHGAVEYDGSSDGSVVSRCGLEAGKGICAQPGDGETAELLGKSCVRAAALGNYKSALQDGYRRPRAGTPVYRVKSESGPDHKKRFWWKCG